MSHAAFFLLPFCVTLAQSVARMAINRRKWRETSRLHLQLAPSHVEFMRILTELRDAFGVDQACALLSVPRMTFDRWAIGKNRPDSAGLRGVWLVWVLTLHPELVETAFDIVTWGAFRVKRRGKVKRKQTFSGVGDGWSDWQI